MQEKEIFSKYHTMVKYQVHVYTNRLSYQEVLATRSSTFIPSNSEQRLIINQETCGISTDQ